MAEVLLSLDEAEQGKLPPCCMRCGAPSVVFQQREFFWIPSPIWIQLILDIGPWFLARLLASKRMRVLIPLCERHKNHWRARSWFVLGGPVLLTLLLVALASLQSHGIVDAQMGGMGAGMVFVLGIIWLFMVIVLQATSIQPGEITNESITLTRVSKEFIEPLCVHRLAHPMVLPEVPRTSGKSVLGFGVVKCLAVLVCIVIITALGPKPQSSRVDKLVGSAAEYGLKGDLKKAIAILDEAIQIAPNHAAAYAARGTAFRKLGDYSRAIQDCSKAIAINPNFAPAYCQRAFAYQQSQLENRAEQAFADICRAIELDQSNPLSFIIRANEYIEQQKFSLAIADLARAMQLNPRSYSAYGNRARVYARLGDVAKARADLDTALSFNPPNEDRRRLLIIRDGLQTPSEKLWGENTSPQP